MSDLQGISIQDFVQHIWGFNSALLQSCSYTASRVLEKDYARCVSGPGRSKAFCDLVEDAHNQVSRHVKLPRHHNLKLVPIIGSTPIYSDYDSQDSDSYQRSASSYQRPDAIVIGEGVQHYDSNGRPLFKNIALCVAFKKDGALSEEHQEEDRILSDQRSSEPMVNLGTKRKSDGRTTGQNKRAKVMTQRSDESQATEKELTWDEWQLVGHAMRSLSDVGNRRFVTGIFVKDFSMTLWYFDRISAIKSEELCFLREPSLFALVVAALFSCDAEHLGYEPLLQHADCADWPFSSVKDSVLTFPFYSTSDSQEIKTPVDFNVVDNALYIQHGVVGRGTVVLPVRLSPGAQCKDVKANRNYVAKFSWPLSSRDEEDKVIWQIRKSVGQKWQRYVPDLKLSMTINDANKVVFLPREYLKGLNSPPSELRVLRILVSPRYEHLRDARSLAEFQKVFVHLVRVHRVVYVKAGVLHRDLSTGNLMFNRDKRDNAYGILNDWDLCEEADTNPKADTAPFRQRAGTLPFMAMDLLCENPPVHRYRHDLESFFWILIWAVFHFELNGKERPSNDLVNSWMTGSWHSMLSAKRTFFWEEEVAHYLLEEMTPALRPLLGIWIAPLLKMFMKYRSACSAHNARQFKKIMDAARLNEVNEVVRWDREYCDDSSDDEDDNRMEGKNVEGKAVGDDDIAGDGLDGKIENEVTSRTDTEGSGKTESEDNGKVDDGHDDLPDEEPWNEETANDTVTFEKFMIAIGQSPELPLD
ncbi:hypothetical protein EVG20_g4961 [Dentipellis fragilis]|uniref:Fungal-type protein kinase domain-containing protein n=1 Tax=Dentipellis fragilis TaxID=205917 RepID=A0A4Y9YU78_9AGAM|nr:hypothetical protein EVG20_g4961 [Dentipellis fragilis]